MALAGVDPADAYKVWSLLEAVEWRWTITEILAQPEALLNAVLEVAYAHGLVKKALDGENPTDG